MRRRRKAARAPRGTGKPRTADSTTPASARAWSALCTFYLGLRSAGPLAVRETARNRTSPIERRADSASCCRWPIPGPARLAQRRPEAASASSVGRRGPQEPSIGPGTPRDLAREPRSALPDGWCNAGRTRPGPGPRLRVQRRAVHGGRLSCRPVLEYATLRQFGRVAQLVRAPASHAGGPGFESLRAHHPNQHFTVPC
jgi:hypothetical protein